MSQNNANKQVVSKSAKRRQRQRKRAIAQGTSAPQKSVQQPRQSGQVSRNKPRRNRRGRKNGFGPLGTDWTPRNRVPGSIFETMDPFGAGWEEKSGMLGVGNTRGIRTSRRDMVIEESEFVTAVTVANQPAFNNVAFPINPGQATLFPWLSTIARQFEKYHFEALSFIFKKEVSEYNAAGAAGKIILSVDFDASDPPPGTKQQMEDTIPHADAMPCQSFSLPLDPRDLTSQSTLGRYVRTGGLPGSTDIKTYDVGNLNVATQGVPANVEIGELHVAYRIRLMKPVLENLAQAPANNQVSWFESTAPESVTTGVAKNLALATTLSNGVLVVNTAGSLVPPPGNYLVDAMVLITDSVGEAVSSNFQIQKNAVDIAAQSPQFVNAAATGNGAGQKYQLSINQFVACNGTDAITLNVLVVGSAGTLTAAGNFRFVAI